MGETPDYGRWNAEATVFPVTDLGELAARLGSPITFDRRGDVVWWDDFEWGLAKWSASLQGTGAAAALSIEEARNGRYSVKLTGGSDGNRRASIIHPMPYTVLGALGLEASILISTAVESVDLGLTLYNGTTYTDCELRWDNGTNELRYLNAAGAWVAFATGVDLRSSTRLFHTLKLVGDFAAGQYVRAIVNERTYSLAGIAARVVANATPPFLNVEVGANSRAGQNDVAYVDDAIVTQNEPA